MVTHTGGEYGHGYPHRGRIRSWLPTPGANTVTVQKMGVVREMELSEKWSCPENGVVRKMEMSKKWSCPKNGDVRKMELSEK